MPTPTDAALSEAVKALHRIRAVEQPPGPDGLREVWHQNAQGVDLVSLVNPEGHVVRQELTLVSDFFRWTSQAGLATGEVGGAVGSKASKPSEGLILDVGISPERVKRAATALAQYTGDDKYIRNIQRVLAMVLQGLQSYDEPTVTRSVRTTGDSELQAVTASKPARKPVSPALAIAAALFLAALGAAVALWVSR